MRWPRRRRVGGSTRFRNPVGDGWQLLRRYLGPRRTEVGLMAALVLASAGLQVLGPRIVRAFIDSAMADAALSKLRGLGLVFIGVSVIAQGLRVLAAYWSERVAWSACNSLRLDLVTHLLGLDSGFHKCHPPGELLERVDGDVSAISSFFSDLVVHLLGSALFLVGVLVAMYYEDTYIGLAFTAYAALVLALLGWVMGFAGPALRESRERSALFFGYAGEVLCATEDVRALNAAPFIFRRFFQHVQGWLPVAVKAQVSENLVWTSSLVAAAAGEAAAFGIGGWLHRMRGAPLSAVYMLVAYVALLAQPLGTIRIQLQVLQQAHAAIARIRGLLETRSSLGDGGTSLPPGPLQVEFRGVTFSYEDELGNQAALHDVSFNLEAGRTLGLLGRTGSGKTTIGRLLFRMYDPANGRILAGGVDLRSARLRELRSRVALVTQDVQLFASTLRDNITLFDPEIPHDRLLGILRDLGLQPWLERLPRGLETPIAAGTLSAGEAQLVALGRAFLQHPDLVILDEFSSRLDPLTESMIERAVATLTLGRTAIVIAHRLSTVESVDQVIILEEGRIAEQGLRAVLAGQLGSLFARLRAEGFGEALR